MIACRPTLNAVEAYAGAETHVALSMTLLADQDTPISVFRKLADGRANSFMLESVEGGELMGRYTFMGCGLNERFEFAGGVGRLSRDGQTQIVPFDDPLEVVKARLAETTVWAPEGLPRFLAGAVGYLGFDCVRYFEGVPLPERRAVEIPEGVLLFADELVIYDHVARRLILVALSALSGDRAAAYSAATSQLNGLADRLRQTQLPVEGVWSFDAPLPDLEVRSNQPRAVFEAAVLKAKEAICAGEIFQVVVSQRFTVDDVNVAPITLYRALRALNPSPYMFFFDFGDFAIVGASPEVLVRVEDNELFARPIAGTRKRGVDEADDLRLEAELLADEKELAEHRMLVDLGRNDIGRVSKIGSVRLEDPLHIERYSHVMHIVSDARGTLRDDLDCFDALRATFPAGTVSGAPKIRACELLAELEPDQRGLYAGAVGYFDVNGNMDTCIAIRAMVVKDAQVHIQAGGGIVYDSQPALEYEESRNKARACVHAIQLCLARASAAEELAL